MAIDTSIYGLIQQPRQEGPLDQYAKAMTVKGLVNQGELQDLQRTQLVDSMDRQKQLRELFAGGNATPEQVMAIDPTTGMALKKHQLDSQVTQANLRKTQIETFGAAAKQLRDLTAAVNDDAGMAMLAERAKVLFGPDVAAKMNIPTRFDPEWKNRQLLTADALLKQVEDEKQRTFQAGQNDLNRKVQERGQNMTAATARQPVWDSDRGVFVPRPGMGGSVMAQSSAPAAGGAPAAPVGGVIPVPGITPKPSKPTAGQEAMDKEFAKELVAFKTGGGADQAKQIAQLRDVATALGSGNDMLTGPVVGNLPDIVKATGVGLGLDKSIAMRERVEEVVQRSLRAILGAQFTEKEGERLIARAYNPKLSEAENKTRVDRLVKQLEAAFQSKQEAADYFEKNGTLAGWQGKIPSISDFDPETPMPGEGGQQAAGKIQPPKLGHREGGYIFKGGDPSKPSSWEKVGQ
jgi:hypothetical protein